MQVVIDSQEKYTNIANVKPLPTPASDREVKVVETTKTTRTLLLGVAAAIGAPTKVTLNGTASRANERGQTQEHKRYTSRITTSDASGVVWWGYNVDDANQRQEGLRMLEGHENLPSASLTYKLPLKVTLEGCPEEEKYGSSSSSTRRTSATKSIDIEVASYWSLISEEKNLSLDVFRKLIATANKNREHVPYSNLIHFVVLTIPPEPQPKSNYVSTMVFQNKYSKTPTLQNYEVGEKEGNIEVFEGVRHNEQGSAGHSGHSLRKTMLSLPSLRNVPLRPRFILQPGQGASQSSRILSDKPYGIYPEALEGDDEAKNFNVKEVESPPAQATDQFNAKGGKQFRLQFAQASMKV
ncbi:hypothetical protein CPC08DRAFT_709388 [Agrocybe pediades]|nr:hypothetical protein CPC08DRAFT_709388 [Agrocybe pediades]